MNLRSEPDSENLSQNMYVNGVGWYGVLKLKSHLNETSIILFKV